jgi:malate dehydrogenase
MLRNFYRFLPLGVARSTPFVPKTAKFASFFIASTAIYHLTRYRQIAWSRSENSPFITTEDVEDERKEWAQDGKRIFTVCVTGAAGQTSYHLFPLLANGSVFGPNVRVKLRMLDRPELKDSLKAVALELEDGCFPLLEGVKYGSDPRKLFKDCDLIIFLGGEPRKPGMSRSDLLKINGKIMQEHGKALNEVGRKDVRCLVVTNPSNTNCLILQHHAPRIPKEHFTSLSMLDHNRAIAQLAKILNKPASYFQNVIVWGNHSGTVYPDISHGKVGGVPLKNIIKDEKFRNEFIQKVQKRGDEILNTKREHPSAMSGAHAIRDHLKIWWEGTQPGSYTSMGVISDGSYGVPEGLFFSFPVVTKYFNHTIVKALELDDFSKKQMRTTIMELVEELEEATKL